MNELEKNGRRKQGKNKRKKMDKNGMRKGECER